MWTGRGIPKLAVVGLSVVVALGACALKQQADAKFGDQHFKTTVALVELYKIRHGTYPESLSALDFVGDWDRIALNSVEYRRLADGYELNITGSWSGKPTLSYPAEFWNGLGLRKSNAKP